MQHWEPGSDSDLFSQSVRNDSLIHSKLYTL